LLIIKPEPSIKNDGLSSETLPYKV